MLQEKILYLGLRPPKGVYHYPVIRTQKIADESAILARWSAFTHGIFTSRTAVEYWCGPWDKPMIAIGEATAFAIRSKGGVAIVSEAPTQEGVMQMLEKIQGTYFYPRSKKARPLLKNYLNSDKHLTVDFYDTLFQKLEPTPDLKLFEKVIFTSPSTVEGFFRIYSKMPPKLKLVAIGPITQNALEKNTFNSYNCNLK